MKPLKFQLVVDEGMIEWKVWRYLFLLRVHNGYQTPIFYLKINEGLLECSMCRH